MADLFTQQGKFGEVVQELRVIARITPIVRLPPPVDTNVHYPPHVLEQADDENQRLLKALWLSSIYNFRDRVIPEVYRKSYDLWGAWIKFLSACLLYDPPETKLLEFARYADPDPVASDTDERGRDPAAEQSSDAPMLPIDRLPDPFRARDDALWYRDIIIDEIGKTIRKLADALGVEPKELMKGD